MAYSEVIYTNQKNNLSVTYTKAIGIILVVLAHAMCTTWTTFVTIYAFHMPLFFIMSGYCFKEKYLEDAKLFTIRKLKGIYLPFVLYAMVYLLLHNFFVRHHIYAESLGIYDWKRILWDTSRITTRMSQSEQLIGLYWFIKELVWGSFIFYAVLRLTKNSKVLTTGILLAITLIFRLFELRIPYFTVDYISFYAATFIAVGYWMRDWKVLFEHAWRWLVYAICVVVVAIEVRYFGTSTLNVTMSSIMPFFFSGIAGTILVFQFSTWLTKHSSRKYRAMEYIGNHTMVILSLHLLCFKFVSYLIIEIEDLPIDRLAEFPVMEDYSKMGWYLVYTIVGIGVPVLSSLGYGYVKSLIGKKHVA